MANQTNTFAATLDALAPTHTWKLDEAAGNYADTGSSAAATLSDEDANINWRVAPGLIRGEPREYGYWTQGAAFSTVGGPQIDRTTTPSLDAGSWTETSIGVVGVIFSFFEDWIPIYIEFDSSTGEHIMLRVIDDSGADAGKIEFKCVFTGFELSGTTTSAAITLGVPFLIVASQRNDLAGIAINVNGVDVAVTLSTSGIGVTNDSWADDLATLASDTGTCSGLVVGSDDINPTTNSAQTFGIIQRPFIFVNSSLSNTQITALHRSASFDGEIADYWDAIQDVTGVERWAFITGFIFNVTTNIQPPSAGGIPGGTAPTWFVDGASAFTGTLATDTDLISDYTYQLADLPAATGSTANVFQGEDFGGTSGPNDINIPFDTNDTTGSIGFLLSNTAGITSGTTKPVLSLQTDNNLGAVGATMKIWVAAGGGGLYSVVFRMEDDATNAFYQQILFGVQSFVGLGEFFMLTVVQDGVSGLKIYINDSAPTKSESSSGVIFDKDSWFADMANWGVNPTIAQYKLLGDKDGSGSDENWGANDFHSHFGTTNALTAAQVGTLWNSVLGIYPQVAAPPPGGFVDTLSDTGNGADPNGPGPNHWWRLNATAAPILDIGINTINGDSIDEGGDPVYDTTGPLILDATNAAVYFDGVTDYLEIGVDAVAGSLVSDTIGTVGFFVSVDDFTSNNIAYSQSDATGGQNIRFGVNAGFAELFMQISAGNSVTFTSSIEIVDRDYVFVVFTNDGSEYLVYIAGAVDDDAVATAAGTGVAEGDWFDDITTAFSGVGVLANSPTWTTETKGQFSELFIFDEVLSATQIGALFDAASADGFGGSANDVAMLVFEDVTFTNGGFADVRMENTSAAHNMTLQVSRSRFHGGAEGTGSGVRLEGVVNGSVRGCEFDLLTTPTTGRAAVIATTDDATVAAAVFGSVLISDCTFNRMGYSDTDVQPAIWAESNFGMTVKGNRFTDCFGAAIGWHGDAARVQVLGNLINTLATATAGIYVQQGKNTGTGTSWQISGNTLQDVGADAILINGYDSTGLVKSRHIQISGNTISNPTTDGIDVDGVQDVVMTDNVIENGVNGISLGEIAETINIRNNSVQNHSGTGIILDEVTAQSANMVIQGNTIEGGAVGDGIYVDGIDLVQIAENKLVSVSVGVTIGDVATDAHIFGNVLVSVTTPFALVAASTQASLILGANQFQTTGVDVTVAANAITAIAPYHVITGDAAATLTTINGPEIDGYLLVLLLESTATFDITITAAGNINLQGATPQFLMDTPGESQIWFAFSATTSTWDQLAATNGTES